MNPEDTTRLRQIIANRLRSLRKAAGLTQEQLSEAAGVGPEHLSKIETARRLPSLEALVSIASALHVEPVDIMGRPSQNDRSERAERLSAVLSKLCDEDADFLESEILNWVAGLLRARR